ncbi:MAG: tetratricopeptide repeat protein [Myxococcota bacterium]
MFNDIRWSTPGKTVATERKQEAAADVTEIEPLGYPALVELARGRRTWAQLLQWTPSSVAGAAEVGRQLFEAGRLDEARLIFETLAAANPRDAHVLTALGVVYLSFDERDRARMAWRAAVAASPRMAFAWLSLAELEWHEDRVEEATEYLKRGMRVVDDGPQRERAHALAENLGLDVSRALAATPEH